MAVHRPIDIDDYRKARHRLKWDEAFVLQAALAQRRHAAAALPATPRPLLSRRAGRGVRLPAAVQPHRGPVRRR